MDFSGVNAHLVDVQNELNLLQAEAIALETALANTKAELERTKEELQVCLDAQKPPEPQRRVLWGASTAPAPTHHGTSNKEAEARYLEGKIGRKFDITRHYIRNGVDWIGDKDDGVGESIASGRNIMLTFTSAGNTWPEVASGALDTYVDVQCKKLTDALHGLMAFVAFENEPEAETGKGTPAGYVKAADRVLAIVNDHGLLPTTALMEWTWRAPDRDPEDWIPTNITHLGVHRYFYNLGTCGTSWPRPSFLGGLQAVHATAEAHGVRLGVWEGGQQEDMHTPNPDFKANWCRAIPGDMEKLPLLDAFTWWHSGGKEGPFAGTCAWERGIRIDSTTVRGGWKADGTDGALAGYTEAGKAPILNG